jgi:hypothetical protein
MRNEAYDPLAIASAFDGPVDRAVFVGADMVRRVRELDASLFVRGVGSDCISEVERRHTWKPMASRGPAAGVPKAVEMMLK